MNTKATLLTIGDEILIGQIVDTNSAFIAQELNKIGIEVEEILSVQDQLSNIIEAFERGLKKSDIVIVTGGLGPTKDDKTKTALCKFSNCDLVLEKKVLDNIYKLFQERGYKKELNELNKQQAFIPEKSSFIQNKYGTAPCLWTTKEDKIIINLPGVPYEMKAIITNEIIPRLKKQFDAETIIHRDILIHGIPESDLALLVKKWEEKLPKFIHLAYLPNRSFIDLRFSAKGKDELFLKKAIQDQIDLFKLIAGKFVISYNSGKPQQVLGEILKHKKLTISLAESCTGGNISALITSISGSSKYFSGSVIAYASQVKSSLLNVDKKSINQNTVVSQQVAEQMAEGILQLLNTNIAISTTGVAGPNKGEDGKNVGSAWISVTNGAKTISKQYLYPYLGREDFIKVISNNAINLAIKFIRNEFFDNKENNKSF